MTSAQAVRDQYEALPYPPRNPVRELEQLHQTLLGELKLVSTVFWGGSRQKLAGPLRILDAGCGTGDASVFMAEQLKSNPQATVIGLDLSDASLEIARQRAGRRGLANVTFLQGRIEDLPAMSLGLFDYIVSQGVLHHLPEPEAGLRALAAVLADGGGMGIMLYGEYGRSAIYQLQSLFQELAPATLPVAERLRIVKHVLGRLSPEHWANLGKSSWSGEVKLHGDAGLFDLFLHSCDRAYTVPQLYDFVASAGLELARFDVPSVYDPSINWPGLDLSAKTTAERQAIAEALNGRIRKHMFFVRRRLVEAPAWDDLSAAPAWLTHDSGWIIEQVNRRPQLAIDYEGLEFRCALDGFRREFLRLVDGERTLGQILEQLGPKFPKLNPADLRARWLSLHEALGLFNVLGLMLP